MHDSKSLDNTSLSLLSRVRQQDTNGWSQLVQLYGPLVAYWCRRYQMKPDDVADVSQSVFIAVSRGIDSYQPPTKNSKEGGFRAWLWVITRNKIRDWGRARRQDEAAGGSSAHARIMAIPDADAIEESSPEMMDQILSCALGQIRQQFQEQTWAAFWRTVVDGQTTQVVADELEMKPAAIRQARSRVLRQLRKQLGDVD